MSVCVKCKKVPPCIDIKFALYCSQCFQEATYHKYRTLLARSRENESANDRNSSMARGLILLPRNFLNSPSIRQASQVLIHFTQLPGIQEPHRKNLICYDLAIPFENGTIEEANDVTQFIKNFKEDYPNLGQIYALSLFKEIDEEILNFSECSEYFSTSSENIIENFMSDLSNISSTLKEDILNAKLLHLQLKLMNRLGIDRALSTETSTALAAFILSCICKGRGKFLPWDSALTRSFPHNLFISRPLKEISDREVELYCQEVNFKNNFNNTKIDNNNCNNKSEKSELSIDKLTVNFLTNLEAENSGTANVVIRTSSKVTTTAIATSKLSNCSRCSICLAPSDEIYCSSCEIIKSFFETS